jgi:ribosome-associated protein
MDGLRIGHSFIIPGAELEMRFSASGGPGGQHANKVATRVELRWNIAQSGVLSERQRARLLKQLSSRVDGAGILRVVADDERSQLRNREAAKRRMSELVGRALRPPKPRHATNPTRASKERRLRAKKIRSDIKKARRDPLD